MKSPPSNKTNSLQLYCSRPIFLCAILAAVIFIIYWPATKFEFSSYDDQTYYVNNPQVQAGLTAEGIQWAFSTGTASNWHPLTWLSHMMDADMPGKPDPGIPHFTNILFHALNSVLLFLLLKKITGVKWRSLFVAGLFALHPLNVESVAWVSERKNVLSTFFWLLTIFAYARYAVKQKPATAAKLNYKDMDYMLALACFALGLMSKPMVVTLPFVLLLLDYWPWSRWQPHSLREWKERLPVLFLEKIPFFILSVLACIVTFLVQQHGKAVQSMARFSAEVRIENALVSYLRYIGKTFWPVNLAVDYPHPGHWPPVLVIFAAAFILVASIAAIQLTKSRYLCTGWFWFLGTLVPVIGIVQVGVQSMADRYAYVPLIGIFIIIAWGGYQIWSSLKFPNQVVFVPAIIILAVLASQTRTQLDYWQNDGTLFGHAVAVTKQNAHAHASLGVYLEKTGERAEALKNYREAEAIDSDVLNVHFDLGNILDDTGQPDEAVKEYHEAIRVDPSYYPAHYNLGLLLKRLGRRGEAIKEFNEVLHWKPDLIQAKQQLETLGVEPD